MQLLLANKAVKPVTKFMSQYHVQTWVLHARRELPATSIPWPILCLLTCPLQVFSFSDCILSAKRKKKMKFSEMKLRATNGVKSYFKRNWRRQDLMNSENIPQHAYTSLKRVYLTIFCATLSFTFGSFLHLIWEAGGPFTVFSAVASSLWLYFISPWRVRKRVLLLMYAYYNFGASFGLFTNYLFEVDQVLVVSLLAGSTVGIGTFWFAALLTRERKEIYMACLVYSCALIFSSFVVNAFGILDSHTAHWMLKVYTMHTLFMGYLVVYSQELLYDARFGDINFVNCTLTVFFNLPAIMVHAARLYLGAEIEQHRQN